MNVAWRKKVAGGKELSIPPEAVSPTAVTSAALEECERALEAARQEVAMAVLAFDLEGTEEARTALRAAREAEQRASDYLDRARRQKANAQREKVAEDARARQARLAELQALLAPGADLDHDEERAADEAVAASASLDQARERRAQLKQRRLMLEDEKARLESLEEIDEDRRALLILNAASYSQRIAEDRAERLWHAACVRAGFR